MKGPILWFGGKGHMTKKIVPLFPPHKTYVEPFGGGASLLLAKEPSMIEVYNDIDSGLVNFFRVLRDPEKFARFYHLVSFTPYSREEYTSCRGTWESCEDDVARAYQWYVVARQSFGGRFGSGWGYARDASAGGIALTCSRWLSALRNLPAIHERLMMVQIEHTDFRDIFRNYDSPETLFYVDPPYVQHTRRDGQYAHEMTDEDHRELVDILLRIDGMAVVSGYNNEIYAPLEAAGWERIDFQTACHSVGKTRLTGILGEGSVLARAPRTESVWRSPSCLRASNCRTPYMFEHDDL